MKKEDWKTEYETDFMTDEQILDSNSREQHHEQWRNPFHDYIDSFDLYHDVTERRQPTAEEKDRLDRYLQDLGNLFAGSNIRWHIDGAMNISLLKGEYIGVHKDIDISTDEDDLQKLDELLGSRGFGLFLSEQPEFDGMNKMIRSSPADVRQNHIRHVIIARVNPEGEIIQGKNLNFLDVHILRKNASGQTITEESAAFPESWQEPKTIMFKGVNLNLSHPGEVVYHKMRQGWPDFRKYDEADLRTLAQSGALGLADLEEISQLLNIEIGERQKLAENVANIVYEGYQRDSDMREAEVHAAIISYPTFKKRWGDPQFDDVISDLAEKISREDNKTLERITAIIAVVFAAENFYKSQFAALKKLKVWIQETESLKNVREGIK